MTASEYIALHLQPDHEPAITEAEITSLVNLAKRQDINHILPSETGWTETYDLNWAVAEGWRLKAAKAAGAYQFQDADLVLHREQVVDHCLKMAEQWSKKAIGSIRVVSPHANDYPLEVL